jgi:hypothetical protein
LKFFSHLFYPISNPFLPKVNLYITIQNYLFFLFPLPTFLPFSSFATFAFAQKIKEETTQDEKKELVFRRNITENFRTERSSIRAYRLIRKKFGNQSLFLFYLSATCVVFQEFDLLHGKVGFNTQSVIFQGPRAGLKISF